MSDKNCALSPRLRWWRCALRHMQRLIANPVRVKNGPGYRVVDVLGGYGFRIEQSSGLLTGHLLWRRRGRLRRRTLPCSRLADSPATHLCLAHVISRDARRWARQAGSMDLDDEALGVLGERLCLGLWARWTADGSLQRLRKQIDDCLALDATVMRLARQLAYRPFGADFTGTRDYNRALVEASHLRVLEREAPTLMPLFPELIAQGECAGEPKQAVRQAFIERFGAPRHWRRFLKLPAETLEWAAATAPGLYDQPLLELAALIAHLDSPALPPKSWLQARLDATGGESLCGVIGEGASLSAARAHLQAWINADAAAHERLLVELHIVQGWLEQHKPDAPAGTRSWSWWVRQAEPWDRARRASAQAMAPCEASSVTALPVGLDIELRPLLTALDLYEEARAMAHCLDRWRDDVADGVAMAWSVRNRLDGRTIATAGVGPKTGWIPDVRGYANRAVAPELATRVRARLKEAGYRMVIRDADAEIKFEMSQLKLRR